MRPHGVSRSTFHWSRGTHFSGVRFWNLTASTPASSAPSISRFAISTEPLWLMPISPMTNTDAPAPTARSPIFTRAGSTSARTARAAACVDSLAFVDRMLSSSSVFAACAISRPRLARAPAKVENPFRKVPKRPAAARQRAAVVHAAQHGRNRVEGRGHQAPGRDGGDDAAVVHVVADVRQLVAADAGVRQQIGQQGALVGDTQVAVAELQLF